jgi:hypothetical protein
MASTSMAVDSHGNQARPKIDVDGYLARAASAAPAALAPYFEAFGDLHRRKSVHVLHGPQTVLMLGQTVAPADGQAVRICARARERAVPRGRVRELCARL